MVNPTWLFVLWGFGSMILMGAILIPFLFQEASGEIITIQLSRTCITPLKYNLTSTCPDYQDLLQFDNTIRAVSGDFGMKDGYFQRLSTPYYKHCNYYLPQAFRVVIVVDPDDCWNKYRGAKTIVIYSIKPQDFIFKITADAETSDKIKDLTVRDRDLYQDRVDYEAEVEAKEDAIDASESKIRSFEDQLDEMTGDEARYVRTNMQKQLGWENERLVKYKAELITAEANLRSANNERSSVRSQLDEIKVLMSKSVVNGTIVQGVGRSVEACRNAVIGADLLLVQDTINYMLKNCGKDHTTFDNRKIEYIEQTPINIADHEWYKYKAWMKKVKEECKQKC